MLEQIDDVTNEFLESIKLFLAYPTVFLFTPGRLILSA